MELVGAFAVVLLMVASLVVLVSHDWRVSVGALAGQAIGVAVLVASLWPLTLAVEKLMVGLGTAGILGVTQAGKARIPEEKILPTGYLFRFLAGSLVLLLAFSMAPSASTWIPGVAINPVRGSLALMIMGLLQLGMTTQPLRVIMGLLTVIAGFEIIYASVEFSVLVAGLLAGVDLGLALFGAYLINQAVEKAPE